MSNVPKWFENITFSFAVCKCSQRNKQEQEQYGSYCEGCWETLKNKQSCIKCNTNIRTERLYVASEKIVLCKSCFIKGGW